MNFQNIFIILVLYKKKIEDSITIQSLSESLRESVTLMVYDNSPERQYSDDNFLFKSLNINYYHNHLNPGLSYAYNFALYKANKKKDWLLLLDQDTSITKEYIDEILKFNIDLISNNIVSLVPRVLSHKNGKLISPTKMLLGGICIPIAVDSGILTSPISGINSGTLLRVSFMTSINGFSNEFSLDMLDHWYFREIIKHKKEVYLFQSSIKQDLSVFGDFEKNISITRYKQLLYAESLFISEDGIISLFVFKMRLILRLIKQLNYKNKTYIKLTFKELLKTNYYNKISII